ncbi:DUF2112 family protein [Methanobrevibacter sp.]|uniref:DUF2112 family protein n=1 Tax=Methanobrevibacter sp. TaxID=66852 RepID=UPI00386B0FFA
MNVVVVPDASMIVIPLIEKNGHTYLSPVNFSRYDNMDICEGNLSYDRLITTYSSSEIPSGVKGRLFLLSKVLPNADAAIIIGKRPKGYSKMYNALNELILFGGNSCNNAHSLTVKMIHDLDIPTLKLAYPTNQSQIIDLINRTDLFLKNLNDDSKDSNEDDLNVDLFKKQDKYPFTDLKRLLNNLI